MQRSGWRAFAFYSFARLLLFVGMLTVVVAVGVRDVVVAVLLALLMSGIASYFLLNRPRAQLAASLEDAVSRRRQRAVSRAAREDAIAEKLIEAEQRRHRP